MKSILDELKGYYIEKNVNVSKDPRYKKSNIDTTKYYIESYKSDNPYILGRCKVILSILESPTQNGTYYSHEWADKSLLNNEKFKSKLLKKLILGETDHPDKADGSIKNVSHAVIDIWKDGNEVWGLVEIFNTPNGNILWTLLNAEVILGVSSRGMGDEYFKDGVKRIREDDFEMIGWDFVIDASAIGAEFKEFTESRKHDFFKKLESIGKSYNNNYVKYICESLIREENILSERNTFEEKLRRIEEERDNHEFYSKKIIEQNDKLKDENEKLLNENKLLKSSYLNIKNSNEKYIIEGKKYYDEIDNLESKIKILTDENVSKDKIIEKLKKENADTKYISENNKIEILLSEKKTVVSDSNEHIHKFIKNRIPRYN